MSSNLLGLESESKIRKSGVRNIFTPHIPINKRNRFFGREHEVERIASVMSTPGQHILLYGDRGVGKTSLSKTTCSYISNEFNSGQFFTKSCDRNDSFKTLFLEVIQKLGIDISAESFAKSHKYSGNVGMSAGFVSGNVNGEYESTTMFKNNLNLDSPSWLANKVKDLECIFLLDEVDTLKHSEDREKLAEFIKLLSDLDSKFKVVIVGIAKTGSELMAGHQSVQRCLKEIHLERMTDDDIRKIVLNGMHKINKIPTEDVVDKIVNISSGFPHFTHLICLKCAEIAVVTNKNHIEMGILNKALVKSAKDSEDTLSNTLNVMLRKTNLPQEYKWVLLAAAHCQKRDFRSSEISIKLSQLFELEISSDTLSRRLSKLTESYDGNIILTKTGIGCFSFVDPRMPSFIKMFFNNLLGENHNTEELAS